MRVPQFWKKDEVALIAANAVPVIGVFAFGWDIRDMLVLFWAENIIVGIFALLRLARVAGKAVGCFTLPFFVLHFGGFTVAHRFFLFEYLAGSDGGNFDAAALLSTWEFKAAWISLFVSHAYSFKKNFLDGMEWKRSSLKEEMNRPYRRVAVMHLTIIFGFGLAMTLAKEHAVPSALTIQVPAFLLIALKVFTDLWAHRKAHKAREDVDAMIE